MDSYKRSFVANINMGIRQSSIINFQNLKPFQDVEEGVPLKTRNFIDASKSMVDELSKLNKNVILYTKIYNYRKCDMEMDDK